VFKPLWIACLLVALALPYAAAAQAAESDTEETADNQTGQTNNETETVVEEKPMTQAELAAVIVRMLGLSSEIHETIGTRQLGFRADSFALACIDLLRGRGIQPLKSQGGWQPNEVVTLKVLAVIVTQVLGLTSLVEDPENPDDYVAVLEARGLLMTNVRDVLSEIEVVNPIVQTVRGSSLPPEVPLSETRGR